MSSSISATKLVSSSSTSKCRSGAQACSTKTYVYNNQGGGKDSDVTIEYSLDMSSITRLEEKIRMLHDDLEYERDIRQRIEREKADLSVTVIQLNERIEEVEAGADGQFEINRKRDAELSKLRKLLEDVHLESEQTTHVLKKKHQEAVIDFQDQIDILTKSRTKIEKEKSRFQQESYDLTEQLERVTLESANYCKSVKSLNIQIQELSIKIEELNRTVIDLTSIKQRISSENVELSKYVNELKVKIEDISYQFKSASSNLEEYKRKYEEEERRRRKLENDFTVLSTELANLRCSYDEECEIRIDIERKFSNETAVSAQYKSRYEQECRSRAEEVDDLKKKYTIRINELEETISSLSQKLTSVDKQRQKLAQEIEILILDLEKSNTYGREMKSRLETLDREYKSLIIKHEELSILYETTSKELRIKLADLAKATQENAHLKEQNDRMAMDNKRLGNENADLKGTVTDLSRIRHDLELEVRRLEAERNELANALSDSEGARKDLECRYVKICNEYQSYKTEMERKYNAKEEELESVKKQMAIEIDQLNARVVEAETRLKTEVAKIKKKMQITITELEMTLDTANKTNIDLHKTVKRQGIQLQELQNAYDEVQRQLQQTLDQYGVAQRRLQSLTAEYEEARANLESAIRGKRSAEIQYEEASVRLKDLSTININLSNAKSKLEQEISIIAGDYDEVSKELRLSDERLQKTSVELKRTVEILHEEQERVVKIESIRKSLEVEVKNLTIRIENVEANALANTKRMVSKLEARVHDLELELDEERRRHNETGKILKKKDRNVKELVLQCEEDHKNIMILQDTLDKTYEKVNIYKRQLNDQETMSQTNVTRVRRFQRELEAAEERADVAESSLSMVRAKHRSFVTSNTTTLPSGEQVIVKETITSEAY